MIRSTWPFRAHRIGPRIKVDPKPRLPLEVRQNILQESAFRRSIDNRQPDNVTLRARLLRTEASKEVKQEYQ